MGARFGAASFVRHTFTFTGGRDLRIRLCAYSAVTRRWAPPIVVKSIARSTIVRRIRIASGQGRVACALCGHLQKTHRLRQARHAAQTPSRRQDGAPDPCSTDPRYRCTPTDRKTTSAVRSPKEKSAAEREATSDAAAATPFSASPRPAPAKTCACQDLRQARRLIVGLSRRQATPSSPACPTSSDIAAKPPERPGFRPCCCKFRENA
jgi:hypothetical protein